MYTAPLSSLLRFVSARVSDVDRTLLFPSFVHVMSGCGLPVALQNKFKLLPSTTSLYDGAVTIFGGTARQQKKYIINAESITNDKKEKFILGSGTQTKEIVKAVSLKVIED